MFLLKLSPKKLKAIAALIETGNRENAARQANVSLTTIQRWLRDDSFLAELSYQKNEILRNCRARLAQESMKSLTTLCQLRDDTATPASIRYSSAKSILELAIRDDAEKRLAAIERAISELDENYNGN